MIVLAEQIQVEKSKEHAVEQPSDLTNQAVMPVNRLLVRFSSNHIHSPAVIE